MNKNGLRLLILSSALLFSSCNGGIRTHSGDFTYSEPESYVPPRVDPADYDFVYHNSIETTINAIGKTGGASLNLSDISALLSVISSNDMYVNKMTRETKDNTLYDFGGNDSGSVTFDNGDIILEKSESLTRNNANCTAAGTLAYHKHYFDIPVPTSEDTSEVTPVEQDIQSTGNYSLSVDENHITFTEKYDYDVDRLDSEKRYYYSVSSYSGYLNLVRSEDFVNKMETDFNDSRYTGYVKSLNGTANEGEVTINQVLGGSVTSETGTMNITITYQIIIANGYITKTDYRYLEASSGVTYREIRDTKNFTIESI